MGKFGGTFVTNDETKEDLRNRIKNSFVEFVAFRNRAKYGPPIAGTQASSRLRNRDIE